MSGDAPAVHAGGKVTPSNGTPAAQEGGLGVGGTRSVSSPNNAFPSGRPGGIADDSAERIAEARAQFMKKIAWAPKAFINECNNFASKIQDAGTAQLFRKAAQQAKLGNNEAAASSFEQAQGQLKARNIQTCRTNAEILRNEAARLRSTGTPENDIKAQVLDKAANEFIEARDNIAAGNADAAIKHMESGYTKLAGVIAKEETESLKSMYAQRDLKLAEAKVYRDANKWKTIMSIVTTGVQIAMMI